MLHKVTCRALALALALVACGWLVSLDASALAVGRARGAVLVGRPLELTVPVTLEGQGGDDPCARAELFYGQERVHRAAAARWEPGIGSQGLLHVHSPAPVDEPMVTVVLRIGCGQSTTHRFVMLSELPPQNDPAAPRADADRPAGPDPAARSRRQAPGARLKLEPLEPGSGSDLLLRVSTGLRSEAAADPQRRAAAAALWQALQQAPDESLQDSERLHSVERELKSLRDEMQQHATAVAHLRAEVERARGQRAVAAAIVIGVSILLLAVLGWLGWRWRAERRLQQVGRWFEQHGEEPGRAAARNPANGLDTQPATRLREVVPAPVAFAPAAARAAATAAATAPRLPPAAFGIEPHDDFVASRGGLTRMVGVQELIDVHDKADFFLSIGEYDQAIALLEAHVHDDVETSALAWMDLLELYHSLGRRAEYERLRNQFRLHFTAQVPDFEQFDQPTDTLENYERALGRIVALWPSPPVLAVIEESIFRRPGLAGAEPFSLEAYRELVLLYHVARDLTEQEPAANTPEGHVHEPSGHSLSLVEREPSAPRGELLMVPPPSARLGVDIDLGELSQEVPMRLLEPLDFDLDAATTTPPPQAPRSQF